MDFTLSLLPPSSLSVKDDEEVERFDFPLFPSQSHSKDVFFTTALNSVLFERIDEILNGIPDTFIQYEFLSCKWNVMHFDGVSHCYTVISLYNVSVSHNAIEFLMIDGDFEFYKTIMWKLFFFHDGTYTSDCETHNHKIMFELPALLQGGETHILKDALTDALINRTMLKKTLSATLKNGHLRGVLEATQVLSTIYLEEFQKCEKETECNEKTECEKEGLKEEDLLCLREMMNLILRDKQNCLVHDIYVLSVLEKLSKKDVFASEILKNIKFVNAIFNWRCLPVETFIGSIAVQKATILFNNLEEKVDTDCLL
jgi:hypothetical protein